MCSNLTSSIALNKINSKLKNIAIMLNEIKEKGLHNLKDYLSISFNKQKIQRDELFLLLSGKLGKDKQRKFCNDMDCNPYIRFISYVLHENIKSL